MKKSLLLVCMAIVLASAGLREDDVITKEDGVTVVNTTFITQDVKGYNGSVPIKIYIKKNKIQKIEVLKNRETPKYLTKVKKELLNIWDGLTLKEAKTKQVDTVTGATFTSKALIENVNRGIDYYQQHK